MHKEKSIYFQVEKNNLSVSEVVAVEEALGIKFNQEQLKYLIYSDRKGLSGRGTGKTLCYIIKLCFNKGEALDLIRPHTFSDAIYLDSHILYSNRFFKKEFIRIRNKLIENGIRVIDVK